MEIMTANRRISAASIIGNTVAREKWLSIGIILTVTGADLFVGGAGVLEREFPDCVWTEDDPCVPKRAFEEACPAER